MQQTLLQEYGFEICGIHKITTGVGGDAFNKCSSKGDFI